MSAVFDPVTADELDLTILDRGTRGLTLTVIYRAEPHDSRELGDVLATAPVRYPIRGMLPIPVMAALLRLETRITMALQTDGDVEADRELERSMVESHDRIVHLVTEKTPNALDPVIIDHGGREVRAIPAIELDVSEVLLTLSWLAGNTTVANEVAKALTAGRSVARSVEEIQGKADRLDGDVEPGEASAGQDPLASSGS